MDTNSTIELKGTGTYFRWTCDICGEQQEKDGMDSRVVFEVNDCGSDYDICRACLDAGIEGAAARSIKRAEQLEEWAALHRAGIPDVLRHVSEWKSGADYDAARNRWEREYLEAVKMSADPARVYDFPDGWDSEWQPPFDEVEIKSKPAPKYKLDEPITPPRLTADETEEQLRKAMDDAGMSYYQCGIYAADMDAVMKRDNALYMDACRDGTPKNHIDTLQYGLRARALEAWNANQNLDEMRAAYETAFNAYYEYIFKRDYIGFPEGTDISKVRLERKR